MLRQPGLVAPLAEDVAEPAEIASQCNQAKLLAGRGNIALSQLRYPDAA